MTSSDQSPNADTSALSTPDVVLLLLTVGLAGVVVGHGLMSVDGSNGINMTVKVGVPFLILVCVGIVVVRNGDIG